MVVKPSDTQKRRIVAACEALVRDVFKPTYLAEIVPSQFNYCIDIYGHWRGSRYRFIQRMRSGFAHNKGEEFDAPFARLDVLGSDRFGLQSMCHTGSWRLVQAGLTLDEAIDLLQTIPVLQPIA